MTPIAPILRRLRIPIVGTLVGIWTDNRDAIALLRAQGITAAIRSFRDLREDLRTISGAGGVTIQTPADAGESDPIAARLLLQADGDIVHRVTEAFLSDPAARQAHAAQIDAHLQALQRRVSLVAGGLTLTVSTLVAAGVGATAWSALAERWWLALPGAGFTILAPMAASEALKAWLRRAMERAAAERP